jgi:hypothetical protein
MADLISGRYGQLAPAYALVGDHPSSGVLGELPPCAPSPFLRCPAAAHMKSRPSEAGARPRQAPQGPTQNADQGEGEEATQKGGP